MNKNNVFMTYPTLLTTKQLQEMLQIGHSTALKLLRSGAIKSVKIGRCYRIPKVCVIDYLNSLSR